MIGFPVADYYALVWNTYVDSAGLGKERHFDRTLNSAGKEKVSLLRRVSSQLEFVVSFNSWCNFNGIFLISAPTPP
jgi:hypothetical protein